MTFDIIEENAPVLDLTKDDPSVAKIVNESQFKPRMDVAKVETPPTQMEVMEFKDRLRTMPQVKNLTNEIDINDPTTIQRFGYPAGASIEKVSNELLANTQAIKAKEVTEMMVNIANIMKQFDMKDFDVEALTGKKGFFKKVKEKVRVSYEDLVAKYDNMGKQVDRIANQLKGYERYMDQANINLNKMYEANKQAFQMLEMYVVACDIGLEEIQGEIDRVSYDTTMSEDNKNFITRKLTDNYNLLEQRKSDLASVELVSLQMLPTLSMMMQANYQLMSKINTSFIVTLPIFKMGLVTAIMAKRQEIQARAINELEEATNDIYRRTAEQTMTNARNIAKSVNTNAIKLETVEKVQGIIMNGIDEVQKVTEEASAKRKQDMERMGVLVTDMRKRGY